MHATIRPIHHRKTMNVHRNKEQFRSNFGAAAFFPSFFLLFFFWFQPLLLMTKIITIRNVSIMNERSEWLESFSSLTYRI